MRSHRRLALIRRTVPYLAAAVGVFALLGAVLVELESQQQVAEISQSIATLRAGLDQLAAKAGASVSASEGVTAAAAAVAAVGQRLETLEARVKDLEAAALAAPALTVPGDGMLPPADGTAAAEAPVDPNLPTTDCIPVGTRFMATPNTDYPLCQSKLVITVGAITAETVSIGGIGEVVEASFAQIPNSKCSVMVFSADIEGFGELRVNCN